MATKASVLQRQTGGSGQETLNQPVLNKRTASRAIDIDAMGPCLPGRVREL